MARGRPPVTRARVLNYWEAHGPCSIMQIVRATGADRRHVQRMMRALEKTLSHDCHCAKSNPCGSDYARKARNANSRATRAGVPGKLTGDEVASLFNQASECSICGCTDLAQLELDHVVPIGLGGHNSIANLQLLCRACNQSKGLRILPHYTAA